MSLFDDLNAAFKTWRDAYFEERRSAASFSSKFAKGLQTYIGAPDTFPRWFQDPIQQRYVKTAALVEKQGGQYEAVEKTNPFELVQKEQDGYWSFAIQVALEVDANTYPKQYFGIPIHFIIDAEYARMRITSRSEGEFNFHLTDEAKNSVVYDFVVKLLLDIFKVNAPAKLLKKSPFGFLEFPLPDPSRS
ncbi:MAG: hypothetical protein WDN46_24110 [Methylocella sp.]